MSTLAMACVIVGLWVQPGTTPPTPTPSPAPQDSPKPGPSEAEKPAAPKQDEKPKPAEKGKPDEKGKKGKDKAAPKVVIQVICDEAPELRAWGEKAAKICEKEWPRLLEELKGEGFTPAESVDIVFKKEMKAPASTSGTTISVNVKHVKANRGDYGMMVHELVHVVQQYPRHKADLVWLQEGIADYERFWKYEPQARQPVIKVEKASYKDSYRTSAAFLGFLVLKYDPAIVTKLNDRMRKRSADEGMFKEFLGKPVDELWKEFIEAGAPNSPETQKAWWEAERAKQGDEKK